MHLLSRYSRDVSCRGSPGLHQIKIFKSICQEIPSVLSPFHFHPLLFGRHQISRDKQFCAKGGGGYQVSKSRFPLFFFLLLLQKEEEENPEHLISEISFAPPDLQNLLQPPTGFKTVWSRSSLTSEINKPPVWNASLTKLVGQFILLT
ncbi:hypothetical protein CEXT_595501 [Caerostris extrusa]|uniref:Uncharacterized protein n=1 Tax=Caerostris extrusa TaxID=172846 RepID=A0AAV4Y1Q0_CAEEX|nr:hypothetical protein CEXT_595501 [Caerostris extrusa]